MLKGSDDLTLVQFLMSCASTGEVADYTSAYLGRSAEVSQFTSEFLRRKYAEAAGTKVGLFSRSGGVCRRPACP